MAAISDFTSNPYSAGETVIYTGYFLDQNDAVVPLSGLSALTLSIADTILGTIVNSVSGVNILNTGRGTVSSAGLVTITLSPSDTALLTSTDVQEGRSLVITFTVSSTGYVGKKQVNFMLQQMIAP